MAEIQSDAFGDVLERTFCWTACANTSTTENINKNEAREQHTNGKCQGLSNIQNLIKNSQIIVSA